MQWWDGVRDRGRSRARGRARSGEPGARARAGARAHPARLPAASVAARRRLRDLARTARRAGADRERGDGGPHRHPVGQGRPRRARPAQGGRAGSRDAVGDPAQLRSHRAASRHALDARHRAGGGPGGLRDGLSRRHDGRVPDRVARADGDAAAPEARALLRPRDRGGDRPARPDPGRHGAPVPAPAERRGAGDLSEPRGRGCPRSARSACRSSRSR